MTVVGKGNLRFVLFLIVTLVIGLLTHTRDDEADAHALTRVTSNTFREILPRIGEDGISTSTNCSWTDAGIDFSPLEGLELGAVSISGWQYYLSLCSAVKAGNCLVGGPESLPAMLCQALPFNNTVMIAGWDSTAANWSYISNKNQSEGVRLQLNNGDNTAAPCGVNSLPRRSNYYFSCGDSTSITMIDDLDTGQQNRNLLQLLDSTRFIYISPSSCD